jgi:hypothetical protein
MTPKTSSSPPKPPNPVVKIAISQALTALPVVKITVCLAFGLLPVVKMARF